MKFAIFPCYIHNFVYFTLITLLNSIIFIIARIRNQSIMKLTRAYYIIVTVECFIRADMNQPFLFLFSFLKIKPVIFIIVHQSIMKLLHNTHVIVTDACFICADMHSIDNICSRIFILV